MGSSNQKPNQATDNPTIDPRIATGQSEARRIGRRVTLKFTGEDVPVLERIAFEPKQGADSEFWERGHPSKHFAWTEVPQALAILFVDFATWGKAGQQGEFFFTGKCRASLAASLGDSIHKTDHRIHELFVEAVASGKTVSRVKLVFGSSRGDNVHGKARDKRDRRIAVNLSYLPPDCVEVFWDCRGTDPLQELGDFQALAKQIRQSLELATEEFRPTAPCEDAGTPAPQMPTTPGPLKSDGEVSATARVEIPVSMEATIRDVIKSFVAETQKSTVAPHERLEIEPSIGQPIGPSNFESAVNVAVSELAGEKPDFSPFLRNIIDEFTDLPALPGGTKNLALCDIIDLKVQFPPIPPISTGEKEDDSRIRNLPQAVGEERAWLLIGEGGQGKSTALRFLAHHFSTERLTAHTHKSSDTKLVDALIPIHLTLSRHEQKLTNQIRGALQQFGLSCETETMGDWLRSEPFLFLFDRLDETDSHVVLDEIVKLLQIAPKSRVVVASRPMVVLSKWPFPQARLQPLNNSDIRRLLTKLLSDKPGGEMFDALVRHQSLDPFRRPLFARLLALSSINLTHQRRFTMGRMLRDVLERQFLGLWERRSESNIEMELVREILAWLGCYMVSTDSQSVKWETALRHSETLTKNRGMQSDIRFVEALLERLLKQGLLERHNNELQFWHTNFRDYFAAIWLEQHASRTNRYLKSWSPRWHEPLLLFFGIIEKERLSEEIRHQLLGAHLMIEVLEYGSLIKIPLWFSTGWARENCCKRFFFLLRALAQIGPGYSDAKKQFVKCLPRSFCCFSLRYIAVPVTYSSGKDQSYQEHRYCCDLVGQLRTPEAVEYLTTVETDFATVAPGLLHEPRDEIVSHSVNYMIADDSENGGWANPRSNSDRLVVVWLTLNSPDPRFFLKLKETLAATDPRVRARLLETLTHTLVVYRSEDDSDLFVDLQKRWTPVLVDLALRDEDGVVRGNAVRMIKALVDGHNLPALAFSVFMEALQSNNSETRWRARAAIPGDSLMEHRHIAWRLLEDSELAVVFATLTDWFHYSQSWGFTRAVLKVLKRFADQHPEWKQAVTAIAVQLRAERPEARLHSRCLGLLICATLYGPYNGFVLNAVRALGTLRLKWTSSLLMIVFYDKGNWVQCRREALRILVYVLLRNESQRLVLDGLKDNEEDICALAAHCAHGEFFDAEFHKFVGPILFNLLNDTSEGVRRDATVSLHSLGYIAKDWYGFFCGDPVYLGPPESQFRID